MSTNIIRMRDERGWSQLDLAEKANLHINAIKKLEIGKSYGWPATIERIAKALDCHKDDLYQRPPPPDETQSVAEYSQEAVSGEVIADYIRSLETLVKDLKSEVKTLQGLIKQILHDKSHKYRSVDPLDTVAMLKETEPADSE